MKLILLLLPLSVYSNGYSDKSSFKDIFAITNLRYNFYSQKRDTVLFSRSDVNITSIHNRLLSVSSNFKGTDISAKNRKIPYTFVHQSYIPLLYGFETNNKVLIEDFKNLVSPEVVTKIVNSNILSDQDKKLFIFFTAEYLRLNGISTENEHFLFTLIKTKILDYWLNVPGKNWSSEYLNFKGKKERVEAILLGKYNGDKSYYYAITDNELFIMAAALSLSRVESENFSHVSPEIADITGDFYRVLKNEVVFYNDGTWLLQPDVWKDHPDYKNAGITAGKGISWDASHFSRFPAYLYLMGKVLSSPKQKAYITKLKTGLAKQLVRDVAKYDELNNRYSFTNYMNGNDNKYRVGYKSNNTGYQPSSNYTHIFFSWWKLLDDENINIMYENIDANFSFYEKNLNIKELNSFYRNIINLK